MPYVLGKFNPSHLSITFDYGIFSSIPNYMSFYFFTDIRYVWIYSKDNVSRKVKKTYN
jgi:hypothetical protein